MELATARAELRSLLDAPRPRGVQVHAKLERMLKRKHRREVLELVPAPLETTPRTASR